MISNASTYHLRRAIWIKLIQPLSSSNSFVRKAPTLDGFLGKSSFLLIRAYQRYVSPFKGFRCAHALYTGGKSCSSVAAEAFRMFGFSSGVQEISQQLVKCRMAYKEGRPGLINDSLVKSYEIQATNTKDPLVDDGGCCG